MRRTRLKGMFLAAVGVWVVLSFVLFVGMNGYPELPGQKVPEPWMLSLFLLFLVGAGMWAHIYFSCLHHRLRVIVGGFLGILSDAESLGDSSILTSSGAGEWEASKDTPLPKILLFSVAEWGVIVLGIVAPIGALLSIGAILTGYLSGQISAGEIAGWFGIETGS